MVHSLWRTSGAIRSFGLAPVAHDLELKESFRITGSSFAQVFDRDAVAGPSGIVNNLAHLESLLTSFDSDGRLVVDRSTPALAERDFALTIAEEG